MNEHRIPEIKKQLTDEPSFIDYLCSLPEDRYQIVFKAMQLIKVIELQNVSEDEVATINLICSIYLKEGISQLALKAYLYGKTQSK